MATRIHAWLVHQYQIVLNRMRYLQALAERGLSLPALAPAEPARWINADRHGDRRRWSRRLRKFLCTLVPEPVALTCRIEALEPKILMSTYTLGNSTLSIVGDSADATYTFTEFTDEDQNHGLTITEGDESHTYASTDFSTLNLAGGGGHDTVTFAVTAAGFWSNQTLVLDGGSGGIAVSGTLDASDNFGWVTVAAGTVTLGTDLNASGGNVAGGSLALADGSTLTLGSSGLAIGSDGSLALDGSHGDVAITGGTLANSGALTVVGTAHLNSVTGSGSIAVSGGTLTLAGTASVGTVTIDGGATMAVASGATLQATSLTVASGGFLYIDGELDNTGTMTVSGTLALPSPGNFVYSASRPLNLASRGILTGDDGSLPPAPTLQERLDALQTLLQDPTTTPDQVRDAITDYLTARLAEDQGVAGAYTQSTDDQGHITRQRLSSQEALAALWGNTAGNYSSYWSYGPYVANSGTLSLTGGTLSLGGYARLDNTGTFSASGAAASVSVDSYATIEQAYGTWTFSGGTLSVGNNAYVDNYGTMNFSNGATGWGSVSNHSTVSVTDSADLSGLTLSSGTYQIASGTVGSTGTFTVNGASISGGITNVGTVNWYCSSSSDTGWASITNAVPGVGSGTINVQGSSGVTLGGMSLTTGSYYINSGYVSGSFTLDGATLGGTIYNAGGFAYSSGSFTGTLTNSSYGSVSWNGSNSGWMSIANSGTVSVSGSAALDGANLSSGTYVFSNGTVGPTGSMAVSGATVSGSITNYGTLSCNSSIFGSYSSSGTISNAGTVNWYRNDGNDTRWASITNHIDDSAGMVNVQGNYGVDLSGLTLTTGSYSISSGFVSGYYGGFTLDGATLGGTIYNNSGFTYSSGSFTGTLTNTSVGSVSWPGSDSGWKSIANYGMVSVTASAMLDGATLANGTYSFSAGTVSSTGTLTASGASVGGTIASEGTINWTSNYGNSGLLTGSLTNSGTINGGENIFGYSGYGTITNTGTIYYAIGSGSNSTCWTRIDNSAGTLVFQNNAVNLTGATLMAGTFTASAGAFVSEGSFVLDGATLHASIYNSGSFAFSSGILDGTIHNEGSVAVSSGSGSMNLDNDGSFTLQNGSLTFGSLAGTGTIHNDGAITITSTGATMGTLAGSGSFAVAEDADLTVGAITGAGSGSISGSLTITDCATVGSWTVNGGTLAVSAGAMLTFAQNGSLIVTSGGTLSAAGGLVNTGVMNLSNVDLGTVLLTNNGTLTVTGTSTLGTLAGTGSLYVQPAASLVIDHLTGYGYGSNNGTLTISHGTASLGTLTGAGTLSLGASTSLAFSWLRQGSVSNAGTLTVGYGYGSMYLHNEGSFVLQGGSLAVGSLTGTGTIHNDGTLTLSGSTATITEFTGSGTLYVSGSSDLTIDDPTGVGGSVVNDGTITISTGTLSGSSWTGSGTLTIAAGGDVAIGDFSLNGGTLAVSAGATLTIPDGESVTIGSHGTLAICGGLSNAGTLTVSGTVTMEELGDGEGTFRWLNHAALSDSPAAPAMAGFHELLAAVAANPDSSEALTALQDFLAALPSTQTLHASRNSEHSVNVGMQASEDLGSQPAWLTNSSAGTISFSSGLWSGGAVTNDGSLTVGGGTGTLDSLDGTGSLTIGTGGDLTIGDLTGMGYGYNDGHLTVEAADNGTPRINLHGSGALTLGSDTWVLAESATFDQGSVSTGDGGGVAVYTSASIGTFSGHGGIAAMGVIPNATVSVSIGRWAGDGVLDLAAGSPWNSVAGVNVGTFAGSASLANYGGSLVTTAGSVQFRDGSSNSGDMVVLGALTVGGAGLGGTGTLGVYASGSVTIGRLTQGELIVNDGTVTLTPAITDDDAAHASSLNTLSIGSTGSRLNLNNSSLRIATATPSQLHAWIAAGRNPDANGVPRWNGSGIVSASALAALDGTRETKTLGYDANGNTAYASIGDLNLDGHVNAADEALFQSTGTDWFSGDLNYDGSANSSDSALFYAIPNLDLTLPTAPTGLVLTPADMAISLTWTAATDNIGVDHYAIRRNGTTVGTTTNTNFSDTGLTADTTYDYVIVAYDAAGNSSASSAHSAKTDLSLGVTAQAVSTTDVAVQWASTFGTERRYTVQWASNAAFTQGAGSITVDSRVTAYTVTGLTTGNTYYFRVQAFDAVGNSAYSQTAQVTLSSTNHAPRADNLYPVGSCSVDLLGTNSPDPDSDTLQAYIVTRPRFGTLSGVDANGLVTGQVTYAPGTDNDCTGLDQFTYKLTDGQSDSNLATVVLGVTPAHEGLLCDHGSPGSPIYPALAHWGLDSQPAHGHVDLSLFMTWPTEYMVSASYTPDPDDHHLGFDSFTYHSSDSTTPPYDEINCGLNVVDYLPHTGNQTLDAWAGVTISHAANVGLLAGVTDPEGDPLRALVKSQPAHGKLQLHADGSFLYTADSGYAGADQFTWAVDDSWREGPAQTVFVTVRSVLDDLDVDSDNNSITGTPDRSTGEESVEDSAPGKYVAVDANVTNDPTGLATRFVPMVLSGKSGVNYSSNAQVRFAVSGQGSVVLWKIDGTNLTARGTDSNRITVGQSRPFSDLTGRTLYIQGTAAGQVVIGTEIDQYGNGDWQPGDSVLVTVLAQRCIPCETGRQVSPTDEVDSATADIDHATRNLANQAHLIFTGNAIGVAVGQAYRFYDFVNGALRPRDQSPEAVGKELAITGSGDTKYTEYLADGSRNVYTDKGELYQQYDPYGNLWQLSYNRTSDATNGTLQQMTTTQNGVTETVAYSYNTADGSLDTVTRSTQPSTSSSTSSVFSPLAEASTPSTASGDAATVVEKAQYSYYAVGDTGGPAGTLMRVNVYDSDTNQTQTKYYRYYKDGDANGQAGLLKLALEGASYARAKAALGGDDAVQSASDAQLLRYADDYYEYDQNGKVTKNSRPGGGCSNCGGQGTTLYEFAESSFAASYNAWKYKRIEKLPGYDTTNSDNPQNTQVVTYYNYANQVILRSTETPSGTPGVLTKSIDYYQYDDQGREILHANPSAVTGYDESYADLVHWNAGNAEYLANTSGLIEYTDYYDSTTATTSTAGGVAGYVKDTAVGQGDGGGSTPTKHYQSFTAYIDHTVGTQHFYFTADETQFAGDVTSNPGLTSTGARTTTYAYTWFAGTNQIESQTVSNPIVIADHNGPGSADTTVTFDDTLGRPIWSKDADGYISYTGYDPATGAVVKSIADVKYSALTSAEKTSFDVTGWTQPSAGQHLITTYQVDNQGRTIEQTAPNGSVTYTVYKNTATASETRTYAGWTGSAPTGPVSVYRTDYARGYSESLTFTWTGGWHVVSGVPVGDESLTSSDAHLLSLSRSLTNESGQTVESRSYFNLTGLTYSTALALGTLNTNYYSTTYAYGTRGQQDRTVSPTGTITRSVYDNLGRTVSTWVGTDDTPTSGTWSPTNLTGTNMVEISSSTYDADGNVLTSTSYPGGSQDPLETDYLYDWRDRLIGTKAGVQTTESTSVNRPITVSTLDNLGETVAAYRFDGDGIALGDFASGVSVSGDSATVHASALVAYSTADYDEQGRAYHTATYSVDPADGSVSEEAITSDTWYNHRGQVIKTAGIGQASTKTVYDGLGQAVKTYTIALSDDPAAGATGNWAAAGGDGTNVVSGDVVLTQSELVYDVAHNAALSITRARYDNAADSITGELGDPTSNNDPEAETPVAAARVTYRLSYSDALGRALATVNLGTNGGVTSNSHGGINLKSGSTWEIPTTIPTASNTVLVTSYDYDDAHYATTVTDPRGIATRTITDALGRTRYTIEAWSDNFDPTTGAHPTAHVQNGTTSYDQNRTTAYTYDGDGHTLTLTAVLPVVSGQADHQTTAYIYNWQDAVTAGMALTTSPVHSNNLLWLVAYPDKTTGDAATSSSGQDDQEQYTYNALGQVLTKTDQNGTVHTYSYDILGRQTADAITRLGNEDLDDTVLRLQIAYDSQGHPYRLTSYNADTGGTVVNELQREYNGLGQLVREYQEHDGEVDTQTSLHVDYAYSPLSAGHGSRVTAMTYPNGKVLAYGYGATDSVTDAISRVATLTFDGTDAEWYTYLGDGTIVQRANPAVTLTYLDPAYGTSGDAGDAYTGLDRFSRVIDQKWIATTGGTVVDRYQYAYDRDGNVITKANVLHTTLSQTFTYDNLNRLTAATGGVTDQSWSLDALGNLNTITTGSGTNAQTVTNDTDAANQITNHGVTYDANGNTTTDNRGDTLTYDAWNRLVKVESGTTVLAGYTCDAVGRRIAETSSGTTADLYYSSAGQVLEVRPGGTSTAQYVWSPVYVNALVCRATPGGGTVYVTQDANFNVTSMLVYDTGTSDWGVALRAAYDAYGKATFYAADWSGTTSNTLSLRVLFQGGWYDPATGFYHFGARDETTDGLWLEPEPSGGNPYVDGLNLYPADGDNPVNRVDPLGLDPTHAQFPWPGNGPVGHTDVNAYTIVIFTGHYSYEKKFNGVNTKVNFHATYSAYGYLTCYGDELNYGSDASRRWGASRENGVIEEFPHIKSLIGPLAYDKGEESPDQLWFPIPPDRVAMLGLKDEAGLYNGGYGVGGAAFKTLMMKAWSAAVNQGEEYAKESCHTITVMVVPACIGWDADRLENAQIPGYTRRTKIIPAGGNWPAGRTDVTLPPGLA